MTIEDAQSDAKALLTRLIAAHPRLFKRKGLDVYSYLMPGWYELVDTLCSEIEAVLGDDATKFQALQLKEKFGALRFYYKVGKTTDARVDLIAPNGVASLRLQGRGSSKADEVRRLVQEAESRSAQTCERCGRPGELRRVLGWITALCDEHAKQAAESRSSD